MGAVNLKYKYIFALLCLLVAFWGGYHFRQMYGLSQRVKKHISLIYSFTKDEITHGNFENLLKQQFRKQGIEPVIDRFYLDCDCSAPHLAIEHTEKYLEIIKNRPLDLILTVGDQSTYSLLSTGHRLLSSVPVVACNVHFPDEDLIKRYESQKVYVLRDTPDFRRNIGFIQALQPRANMEVIYNVDLNRLGRRSFEHLSHVVDRRNVRILSSQSAFTLENEYEEVRELIESYSLMPALTNENIRSNELIVSLCPFRYIKGGSLLVMMKKSKNEQARRVFLQDKSDDVALPIVNALNMPSFSCIREGFGEETKIVGGYMATDEISAVAAADLSVRLLSKEKMGMPKIRDLKKEYVLDWKYFSLYKGYDIKHVPDHVRIINYPFYDRYCDELYLLGGLFILAFVVVSVILWRMHRRSLIEHKNLEMLEATHRRLTLSADGGRISLWNMHENNIEFDDNFTRLTGIGLRKFKIADFDKYIHPDDLQLLRAQTEALYRKPGVQTQRVRFCFGGNEDYRWYELRWRSLKDAAGRMMLAGVMQNIQELVEREHQLVLAKQMAERAELKQSFLNNMSHEIRTPLNAIVGFTNLLISEEAAELDAEEKHDMLKIINDNNELLLKLINDVLEISRLDSGNTVFETKEWNMAEVVKDIYKNYRPLVKASLQFRLDVDESIPLPVRVDRFRFAQVINNFLSNANKFTAEGRITLGCKADKEKNEVCIYVEDTGKGIDEKEQIMIFDRFYKTDEFEQGSGLGLPICKGIIEKLSGRIEVSSKLGRGSRFSVYLSLEEDPAEVADEE